MVFGWTMPVHREPLQIELIIDNFFNKLASRFYNTFQGTALEYWLLDRDGSVYTFFILVALIWIIAFAWNIRSTKRVAPQKDIFYRATEKVAKPTPRSPSSSRVPRFNTTPPFAKEESTTSSTSSSEQDYATATTSPFMKKLAPLGHRPTNANLKPRGSTTAYQTLSPFSKEEQAQHQARHFSQLAQEAPVSFDTLQENGVLNKHGSPTKKWRSLEEKKEQEVVARWRTDGSMRGGRAVRME
jgi:hypothetical protein